MYRYARVTEFLPPAEVLSTSANCAYEVTDVVKTQKDKVENGEQRQLMDGSPITSDEKKLERIYECHNAALFPTLSNAAYGTAGKTLCMSTV